MSLSFDFSLKAEKKSCGHEKESLGNVGQINFRFLFNWRAMVMWTNFIIFPSMYCIFKVFTIDFYSDTSTWSKGMQIINECYCSLAFLNICFEFKLFHISIVALFVESINQSAIIFSYSTPRKGGGVQNWIFHSTKQMDAP